MAWTLVNLANILAIAGDVPRATAYASQAVDIYKRTGGSDEPDHLARALELRGTLLLRRGQPRSARLDIAEALELRRKTFGATHPLTAGNLVQLARADLAAGDRATAVTNALAAEEMGRNHLRFTVRYLPERPAMAYASARPRGLDLVLSIVTNGAESTTTARAFDAVIRSRGVVLDEMAERAHLIADAGPSALPITDQLHRSRQRFANLVLRSLQPDGSVAASALDSARRSKEEAERAVADLSAAGRSEFAQVNIGLSAVRASLPHDSALVSFVQYLQNTPSDVAGSGKLLPRAAYVAFVARAASDRVSVTALGSADSIERLVVDWRAQITQLRDENQVRMAGQRLHARVWAPLAKELAGVSRVFIVPDGALNLVNFAALPSGRDRYVAEDALLLHYLSTERDLVMTPSTTTTPHGLFAVGGPEFEASSEPGSTTVRSADCSTGTPGRFQTLPNSAQEVAEIGRLWSSLGRTAATVLMGRAASEDAVRKGAVGRSVVHFATHGFFLGAGCQSAPAGTRAVGGLSRDNIEPGVAAESPLALAGLAFAGANRHSSSTDDDHDGILTAEEIAGLNLQGTQWAVLSACDTGIGQVQSGEGVFGLKRAFQIAGVKTVIMSLWSVEDESTRQFMRDLYEVRLRDRLDTAETVRTASLRLLNSRRERKLSTHPFYWAAFVASGDWR